ncbi:DNA-binding response regulator [Ktedonobacter sp. SOSP1-52]|uniref:response regulator transcription factor n=1 Tax=Ktedonobacter sp. SOSP1-52 TaxID=2778366 RepID=UPI00191569EF|nr:response regulator transcription factor [Ktedonobacter sp. SOSP1-52]GHO70181.1 DNA-binding response regulator [Ktedonobacter sp. SOSP1-52]
MEQRILIAEPREVIRTGLRVILERDEQIKDIYEAFTSEDLRKLLHSYSCDLIIVHQSLASECTVLPMSKFILLVDEPDMDLFVKAYRHKVRGYLSTSLSSDLLFAAIHTTKDSCLLDPVFLPWFMEHMFTYMQDAHEFNSLSPREREVAQLIKNGIDRRSIAQQLHISEATLKTHIKNMVRKQGEMQPQPNILPYQPKSKLLKQSN